MLLSLLQRTSMALGTSTDLRLHGGNSSLSEAVLNGLKVLHSVWHASPRHTNSGAPEQLCDFPSLYVSPRLCGPPHHHFAAITGRDNSFACMREALPAILVVQLD